MLRRRKGGEKWGWKGGRKREKGGEGERGTGGERKKELRERMKKKERECVLCVSSSYKDSNLVMETPSSSSTLPSLDY
jgi:hypothetical protein